MTRAISGPMRSMPAPKARAGLKVLVAWPGVTSTRTVWAAAGDDRARIRMIRGNMRSAWYPRTRPSRYRRAGVVVDAVELLQIDEGPIDAAIEGQLHPDVPVGVEVDRAGGALVVEGSAGGHLL